jgi:hypothetical protein
VRFVGPLILVVLSTLVTLILLVAPESCVLAERDPEDDGGDGTAPPPPPVEAEAPDDALDECVCCGKTILPLSPDCSGEVAFAISAADCPKDCKGKVAYVLCEGVCYSACACDLPPGFSLVDGGS